jgi:GntR family transcriptional repressor for pyruvate dehydrogenase complex
VPLVSDHVFASLLEAVLSGRYAAGEKLPTQRALAADLGVTMGSLREALKRLEQMGLVESRQGDAMRVRDWREHGGLDVVAHLLFRSGGLDAGVLADVLEARSLMLRELAGLAALRRSEAQAERLAVLARAIAEAPDDAAAQAVDFAWATELAQAAGNLVFLLILNAIRALYFEHAASLPVTARRDELAPLYERAARAIGHGRAEEARTAVEELAAAQRERVESTVAGVVGEAGGTAAAEAVGDGSARAAREAREAGDGASAPAAGEVAARDARS